MKLVFGARHLKFASLVLKPQSGPADSCAYTLHLQRISAATRAGLVIVEMKEKTFRNILDIAKKAGVTRRF
jgi:hypothetical protein